MTDEAIFTHAIGLPPEQRAAYLDEVCAGDAELRARVERLLRSHEMEDSFLMTPVADFGLDVTIKTAPGAQTTMGTSAANPAADVPFIFGRRIAQGGMGAILEADDCKLGRKIAAKVMLLEQDASEDMRQRFIQEAAVLAKLAHPNIVPVYDLGHDTEGQLYYTMKLVKGRTLQNILDELRREHPEDLREFTLERLLTIFRKVADALAFAHSKGIIHRDLKPENVMVGEFGEVLLMDWGLAKMLNVECGMSNDGAQAAEDPHSSFGIPHSAFTAPSGASPTATLQGAVMGTPRYMSPEQAMGQIGELDERSDIFSLGGILYAILTLRPPVDGKDLHEILEKVKAGGITPPTEFGVTTGANARHVKGEVLEAKKIKPLPHIESGRVPAALSAVAMKALTLDKAQRYQSVAAFSADIERYQTGFATSAENAGFAKQAALLIKRNKGIFTTAFAAWLIITALAVWFVFNLKAKEQRATKAEAIAVQKGAETSKALARSSLSLAEAALREGNGPAIQAALGDVPEDLRDSTWRYLLGQADTSFTRIDVGQTIWSVVAHPRLPSVFVVVDAWGRVTILNVRTGERLLEFAAELPRKGYQFKVAISPDGERIAIGHIRHDGPAGGIVIHDARTGAKLLGWESTDTGDLEFSPDGLLLLQRGKVKSEVNLWNATNGRLRWTHDINRTLTAASFTPDGRHVFARYSGGLCKWLTVEEGKVARTLVIDFQYNSALHPDAKTVVAAERDGTIKGFDLEKDREIFKFRTDGQEIRRLAFTATRTRFVSIAVLSDGRQAIRLWDTQTGAPVQSLLGGSGEVWGASVHPLSGELVVCGPETRAWSLGGARWTLRRGGGVEKCSIAFCGADDVIFGPSERESVALLRLEGRSSTALWTPPPGSWYDMASVSADGRCAAVGHFLQKSPILLLRRNGEGLEQVGTFTPTYHLGDLRVSPSGGRLVAVQNRPAQFFELFDTATGAQPVPLMVAEFKAFADFAWLSEEHLLGLATAGATRGRSGTQEQLVVWDVTTREILRRATHPSAMDVLAVAPDGRRFAEAGADKKVRIRDAATLAVLKEFRVHDAPVTALAWHPKKPILATGSADLTIRLWNLETGERIDELRGPLAAPHSLAFSPSGQRLGCASADVTTRIWDPPSLRDPTAPPLDADGEAQDEHVWFKDLVSDPSAAPKVGADGWADVLRALTPAAVEKSGHGWSLKDGELLSPDTRFATLPLPARVAGISYQVHVRLRRLAEWQAFHVVLPVADRMCGFDLDGRPHGGIYTGLIVVNGKWGKNLPGVVEGKQVNDTEPHDLEVTVRLDAASATITATLDARPLYEWTGANAALSQAADWAKTSKTGALAFGTITGGWAVSEVKVKRLEAEKK
ncbi:MAG: serine/threonine-protein kinase [Verrucomicrobiaceae bacterium]